MPSWTVTRRFKDGGATYDTFEPIVWQLFCTMDQLIDETLEMFA